MTTETEAATSATAPAARWEDFVDIFLSPREVFRRRRDGRFGVALIVVTLVTGVLTYVMLSALSGALEADMIRAMQAAGNDPTPETLETMRTVGRVMGIVGAIVSVPVGIFLAACAIWIVGGALGVRGALALCMTVATYATFPRVLATVVAIAQGLFWDPPSMSSTSIGPARFLAADSASPMLLAMLNRLDLFVIWSTVLVALGIREAIGAGKTESWLIAVIVWALGGLPLILPVLLT